MAEKQQFRRGEQLRASQLNQLQEFATSRPKLMPGAGLTGNMANPFGQLLQAIQFHVIKLVELRPDEEWVVASTAGIDDDVTSAVCIDVLWTTSNTYSITDNEQHEVTVYNSAKADEPAAGQRFWAAFNLQSGRYEILAAAGGSTLVRFRFDDFDDPRGDFADGVPNGLATPLAITCGQKLTDAQKEYDAIRIHDGLGCILSEELLGQQGWAHWVEQLDDPYNDETYTEGYFDKCRWEVIVMCCPTGCSGDD